MKPLDTQSIEYGKVAGMLLGLHAGDSLGATLEFKPASPAPDTHREIIGGGPLGWQPGDATDDTDLMICCLESIVRLRKFKLEDLAERFVNWYHTHPPDIGNTTRVALERLIDGVSPYESGENHEYSAGNGSLMRCAPLVLLAESPQFEEIARWQTQVTHAHPVCAPADFIFLKSLDAAVRGLSKEEIFRMAVELSREKLPQFVSSLQSVPSIPWARLKASGYVLDTLQAAFWGLMNTSSFEEAVTTVVNRGDDADTCGAVTGALCGAYYGVEGVPDRWRSLLRRGQEILGLLCPNGPQ